MKRILIVKRILMLLLLTGLLLQLFACAENVPELPDCSAYHGYTQVSYYNWDRVYDQYPSEEYVTFYEKLGVSFRSCSSFYRAVKKERLDEEALMLAEQIDSLQSDQNETNFHDDGIHKPKLGTICELFYGNKSISNKVVWYGCSEYLVECSLAIGDEKIPCFFASYGDENFPVGKYNGWETSSYTENEITYTAYTQNEKNRAENPYCKEEYVWSLTDGAYHYRIIEKTLEKYTVSGEIEDVVHLACVEIEYDSNFYYVYIGDSAHSAPTLTPEIVKSFTLKSFD